MTINETISDIQSDLELALSYVKDCIESLSDCEHPQEALNLLREAKNRITDLETDVKVSAGKIARMI